MPKTILVDDDPTIRTMLKSLLAILNFEVIGEAVDGKDAINKINSLSPEFVLLDINMPFKTGDQVLEELNSKTSEVCVVMVSQISEIDIVKKCIDLGAFYYIKKDVPFLQMVQIIQNTWEKFAKAKQNGKSAIESPNETQKDYTYRKIIEDKFFFLILNREIIDKNSWTNMVAECGSVYDAFLNLVNDNPQLKDDLGWLWATAMNCSFVNASTTQVSKDLIRKMPRIYAEKYGIIPLYTIGKSICISCSNILSNIDKETIAEIIKGKEIDYVFSFPDDIKAAINKNYPILK